jgi:hypothetical protein
MPEGGDGEADRLALASALAAAAEGSVVVQSADRRLDCLLLCLLDPEAEIRAAEGPQNRDALRRRERDVECASSRASAAQSMQESATRCVTRFQEPFELKGLDRA